MGYFFFFFFSAREEWWWHWQNEEPGDGASGADGGGGMGSGDHGLLTLGSGLEKGIGTPEQGAAGGGRGTCC
jgi:hypothetical protein